MNFKQYCISKKTSISELIDKKILIVDNIIYNCVDINVSYIFLFGYKNLLYIITYDIDKENVEIVEIEKNNKLNSLGNFSLSKTFSKNINLNNMSIVKEKVYPNIFSLTKNYIQKNKKIIRQRKIQSI